MVEEEALEILLLEDQQPLEEQIQVEVEGPNQVVLQLLLVVQLLLIKVVVELF